VAQVARVHTAWARRRIRPAAARAGRRRNSAEICWYRRCRMVTRA